jgi:hypothetical protein
LSKTRHNPQVWCRLIRSAVAQGAILCVLWVVVFVDAVNAIMPQHPEDTPASIAAPQSRSPVQSLAMLIQIVRQLETYVRTKDLGSIHNEDVILGAALNELFPTTDLVGSDQIERFKADLISFGQQVSALHLVADLNQQTQAELELQKAMKAFEALKTHFSESVVAEALKGAATFTCPMDRDVIGLETDACPKCGMILDQMVRILPDTPGISNASREALHASIRVAEPLTVGQPATVYLMLQKANGDPVLLSDLIEAHTKKIHLLIIDGGLTDYRHEHPEPTRTPGEYVFSFTPKKPGNYRVWADLRAHPLGLQEYAVADIPGAASGEPLTDRTLSCKASVNGRNYELLLPDTPLKVGRPASARLRITSADGKGFTELEPVMAAFAHIVGFNEDYKTVLHMHPKGAPLLDEAARGGPELEFQIYALRPGFVRLFTQVQIAGQQEFAPFGIAVVP